MSIYYLYCRPGFEKDLAAEIQQKAALKEIFGYCRLQANAGYIEFDATESENGLLFKVLKLEHLIFCRQWFRCIASVGDFVDNDRINPILAALDKEEFSGFSIDYPDTNDGKEIAKFAKKFTLPLTKALEKRGLLKKNAKRKLHLFMHNSQQIELGFSLVSNSSPHHLGIHRLKSPKMAPSRSTLKLEEAFHHFIEKSEWETRVTSGMNAVDLGAAPGGWTWQLVNRGMFVAAVDNGPMASSLMETGQVRHYQEDGFAFKPRKKNVYWLICDMVEKPNRVAKLMAQWLARGDCQEAIFNLKLPMKQRFQCVESCFELMREVLSEHDIRYQIRAKHLYHDREEITVHLRCLARYD